jgi:hypothetical protein
MFWLQKTSSCVKQPHGFKTHPVKGFKTHPAGFKINLKYRTNQDILKIKHLPSTGGPLWPWVTPPVILLKLSGLGDWNPPFPISPRHCTCSSGYQLERSPLLNRIKLSKVWNTKRTGLTDWKKTFPISPRHCIKWSHSKDHPFSIGSNSTKLGIHTIHILNHVKNYNIRETWSSHLSSTLPPDICQFFEFLDRKGGQGSTEKNMNMNLDKILLL